MNAISDTDYDLLFRLSSVYHAVTLSVTAPVVLPSEHKGSEEISVFSHQYYDTFENERYALETMKKRIRLGFHDIGNHLSLHEEMCKCFFTIDESLNSNKRDNFLTATNFLIAHLKNYGQIITTHRDRMRDESFLFYPACLPGHYFYCGGHACVPENEFNSEQNARGFYKDLIGTTRSIALSSSSHDPLRGIILASQQNSETTSLAGRIETTKEMLKGVGYPIADS